jgi:tRNA(Ile)-lysidine synthase
MIELAWLRQHLHTLLPALDPAQPSRSYLVAYSGGLDSQVLLHLCSSLHLPVRAVHVHHGLQSQADAWVEHCAEVCAQLGIELSVAYVNATASNGDSPEDAARKVRYTALAAELKADECLLTAHHADDQAETFLLQLMRGAGAAGLASMPEAKAFAAGWHCRPLLVYTRQDILAYAQSEDLRWIEDPSNTNTDFDRNLLRQTILPRLQQRWPAVARSISNSALFQQESLALNLALARIDLAATVTQDADILSITKLQSLDRARQTNVLRYWLRLRVGRPPSRNVLLELMDSLLVAAPETSPLLHWGDYELRRYQQKLYLLPVSSENYSELSVPWDGKSRVQLAENIVVSALNSHSPGLDLSLREQKLSLRFRRSGERLQIAGKSHHQDLKKLMQEAGIPPWQRARIPLLYVDDELACVCGYWLAAAFSAPHDTPGWLPVCEDFRHQ